MTSQSETTADLIDSVWTVDNDHTLDEDCNPNKACRNMRDVTFDGYAEAGDDPGAAWRERLAREGKLVVSGESLRSLIDRNE